MKIKKLLLLCLVICVFSACQDQDAPSPSEEPVIRLEAASNELQESVNQYISKVRSIQNSKNSANLEGGTQNVEVKKFDLDQYIIKNLQELSIEFKGASKSAFGVINSSNPNVLLNFEFNLNGEVSFAYFSESVFNDADKSIDSKLYGLSGDLEVHLISNDDGSKELLKSPTYTEYGWWSDFTDNFVDWFNDTADCVGAIWSPTGNTLIDTAFVVAATAATEGFFIPATIAACGILELIQ